VGVASATHDLWSLLLLELRPPPSPWLLPGWGRLRKSGGGKLTRSGKEPFLLVPVGEEGALVCLPELLTLPLSLGVAEDLPGLCSRDDLRLLWWWLPNSGCGGGMTSGGWGKNLTSSIPNT